MAVDNILHILHSVRILPTAVENLSTTPRCCYRRLLLVSTKLKHRPLGLTVNPKRSYSTDRVRWTI